MKESARKAAGGSRTGRMGWAWPDGREQEGPRRKGRAEVRAWEGMRL